MAKGGAERNARKTGNMLEINFKNSSGNVVKRQEAASDNTEVFTISVHQWVIFKSQQHAVVKRESRKE
jgi:hypothetical protein